MLDNSKYALPSHFDWIVASPLVPLGQSPHFLWMKLIAAQSQPIGIVELSSLDVRSPISLGMPSKSPVFFMSNHKISTSLQSRNRTQIALPQFESTNLIFPTQKDKATHVPHNHQSLKPTETIGSLIKCCPVKI